MTDNDSQVPWTDEQWARVNQVVQEEARRARVAASFLPLFGPLPPSADFVRKETISESRGARARITIEDTDTTKLLTLQVKVYIRGAQMADPEMTSALALFRRAANVLARLEDALIFNGRPAADGDPDRAPPKTWEIRTRGESEGLLPQAGSQGFIEPRADADDRRGAQLVTTVSTSIGTLEQGGHFGPFAVVLGQTLFVDAQTPDPGSLVLPQDRIIPFLGGGPLLRSSTLPDSEGVVVALGGGPVELVVATDASVGFLQVTTDPEFAFRVFEKIAVRIKQRDAIIRLTRR
jgi:uncharacterized linocin/CFP29 family protein